jgi:beta-glucosidase
MVPYEGVTTTQLGWPVLPDRLTSLLVGLGETYGAALPPLVVTENGCAVADEVSADGAVHDQARIDFLDAHVRAVHAAIEAGADVRGYDVWSFLDNFEWAEGYEPRFGVVHVDYATQQRTRKDSFAWYRALASGHPR